jgi:hypothetical protein
VLCSARTLNLHKEIATFANGYDPTPCPPSDCVAPRKSPITGA